MPESTTMRPCYVFGPWTDRAPEDPIRAVREAPNPSERAEVWLYTKEDDGTPVSSDVAGWYGCFGAMADSVRLGPPDITVDRAKVALDILMFKAGHLFAEDVEKVRDLARIACVEPVALPASPDALARELYDASPLGPVQTWTWDKAPDVVRQVWRDTAMLVLRKYGQPPASSPQEQGQWRDVAVYTPPTPTRRATDTDSTIGDDRAPDRYMASGRETIDEVRDVCRHVATIWTICKSGTDNHDDRKLGDSLFALHCILTAYVYMSRAGRKGDAKQDHAKAGWYIQMARHVASNNMDEEGLASSLKAGRNYDDPRASRCDYKPYEEPMTGSLHVLADLTAKFSPYEFGRIMEPIVNPTMTR